MAGPNPDRSTRTPPTSISTSARAPRPPGDGPPLNPCRSFPTWSGARNGSWKSRPDPRTPPLAKHGLVIYELDRYNPRAMSTGRGDLLLGKIALREGLITREQLFDCLQAQERNPSKSIGSIMVARGYLRNEDVDRLVEIQKKAFEGGGAAGTPGAGRTGILLGKLLADRGL